MRQRYERERPGELLHVDVKKLGRFWCVGKRIHQDDHASGWYAERVITIERVLTDNATAYHARYWAAVCHALAIGRRYTKLYSPQMNGKAEAFIKTMLREWAYRHKPLERPPRPSTQRLSALLQHTPTPRLARSPATDQPRPTRP